MGKEMGREEGAQMGTCPQRRPLQTSRTSVAAVGAETAGSAAEDLKLRPGQSSLHA